MAKKRISGGTPSRFDGIAVKRHVDNEGFVQAYDKNERACWGGSERERVILKHDLRKYAVGLHIGQLGWTVPETTDGYKWMDVIFDSGVRLTLLVYGIERVDPVYAEEIAKRLIAENRNTRFDADPIVAARCYREWIRKTYEKWIDTEQMIELGEGDQELYGFTFPSLQELARMKRRSSYPVKIGYTKSQNAGAIERIRGQIIEAAAFPERPALLLVYRTWSGRNLESSIHAELRRSDRSIAAAIGAEWFMTSAEELADHCRRLAPGIPRGAPKPLTGATPDFADIGAEVESSYCPDSACVSIRVVEKKLTKDTAP